MILAVLAVAASAGLTWYRLFGDVVASPAAAPNYGWVPGQRLHYRLQHVCAGTLEREPSPDSVLAAEEPSWASLRGELFVTVVAVRGEETHITYALQKAVVRAEGGSESVPAARLQEELGREVFATLDCRGRVLSVRFDDDVSSSARLYLRGVLAVLQFVTPDAANQQDAWEVHEETPDGTFLIRYAMDTSVGVGQNRFIKTRVRHVPTPRKARRGQEVLTTKLLPEGTMQAQFDSRRGHLISLHGEEKLAVMLENHLVARRYTSLALEWVGTERIAADTLAELRLAWAAREATPAIALSWRPPLAMQQAASYRHLLGDTSAEDLLVQLLEAEEAPNRVEENALDLKLRAVAYLQPEVCPMLGRALAAAPARSASFPILAQALGSAGHPKAQQALVDTLRAREDDWPALAYLIPMLGMVEAPTPQVEATLRSLSETADWNIRSTAQLALGSMAGNLLASEPLRASRFVDWAVRELSDAKTPAQKRQMLLVLGNARSDQSLAAVRLALTDTAIEVRAAAAHALRWVEAPQAEALLLWTLAGDPEAGVRTAAAVALGYRDASAAVVSAARNALAADTADSVRLAVLPLLWAARKDFPLAGQLVDQAAQYDPSAEVRALAASLSTHSGS